MLWNVRNVQSTDVQNSNKDVVGHACKIKPKSNVFILQNNLLSSIQIITLFMKYKPPTLKSWNDHIALIKTLNKIVVYTLWIICIKYTAQTSPSLSVSSYLNKMGEIRMHVCFTQIKDQEKFLNSVKVLINTSKVVNYNYNNC